MWWKLKKHLSSLSSPRSSSNNAPHSPRALSSPRSSSSENTCAICLIRLERGQGHAIFVAECSHSFHFLCIVDNVKYGNLACPLCRTRWNSLPFEALSGNTIDSPSNIHGTRLNRVYPANVRRSREQSERFYVDEERSITPTSPVSPSNKLTVRSFLEYPAVSASEALSELGVLIRLCAPPLDSFHHRAPVDIVTVLDVSGSMAGKLGLLKRAVRFIIQNLGPLDRLSIVTFCHGAQIVLPLRKMCNNGREAALSVIDSLTPSGRTNVVAGLKTGVRVLEERTECNSVVSMILVSDGHDSKTKNKLEYLSQLPASINPSNISSGEPSRLVIPVHTFGLGEDHDSNTMHAISDASGGTFSFIESFNTLQDAFARCIGGLLSVVIQDVSLRIQSTIPGVQVKSIASAKYKNNISVLRHEGRINVGDLYAQEGKDFLIYLSVPVFSGVDSGNKLKTTSLIDISSFYKDSTSTGIIEVKHKRVEICRPPVAPCKQQSLSLEFDGHINRILMIEAITNSRELAERGDLVGAQALLAKEETRLLCSISTNSGYRVCNVLLSELAEIKDGMKTKESYNRSGRAYALSVMSSLSWQRSTICDHYETPTMRIMVSKSRCLDFDGSE